MFESSLYNIDFTYYNDPPISPPPPPPPPTPDDKKFSQGDLDRLMAEHRKKLQSENKDLVDQLTKLRENVNLTAQEKEALETRINSLSQQHLTDTQKLQAELDTTKKKLSSENEGLKVAGQKWQGLFNNLLVTNAILQGASEHKAVNAAQLAAMLSPSAKVVEVLDEKGQPTGEYAAKLPIKTVDPKTKAEVVIDLPIVEAIGKMREDENNANLFIIDGSPGFGGNGNVKAGSEKGSFRKDMTPEQYREYRKKQKG